ncbi:MAG: hypothetical protein Q9160_005717 [Pyrenula sp. 1 TL-2023]
MPPFLPRKRFADDASPSEPLKPPKKAKLADALDAPSRKIPSLQSNKDFSLGDDSQSSLSDVDSDQFEDVPTERQADDDDEADWEDALHAPAPEPTGDLQLTLSKEGESVNYGSLAATFGAKKGPSKIERQIRIDTHRMHVQFLLFHNTLKNMWISDKEVHQILLKQIPQSVMKDVDRWKVASGLNQQADEPESKGRIGRKGRKSKRDERDWGATSQRTEEGHPDLSRGDPLIPLLRTLAAYWKKRFKITAPGLRKHGYKARQVLQAEIRSFQKDAFDSDRHGERIRNISEFRARARQCNGSRDMGAQLFTALLRALEIESRLVANLQPLGFGWTKAEEALPPKKPETMVKDESDDSAENTDSEEVSLPTPRRGRPKGKKGKKGKSSKAEKEESSVGEIPHEELSEASIIEVTPSSRKFKKYDTDLPFPIYWTEVISPISNIVYPVSPLVLSNPIANNSDALINFEPRGAKADKAKQVMAYVVGFSADGTVKDVTTRYLKRHMWPGRTKGFRLPVEKIAVYNRRGKVKRYEQYDWFKVTMSPYGRPDKARTVVDDLEDSTDLVPQQPEKKDAKEDVDTLQSLRASADFVLERFLRREEALKQEARRVRTFTTGKGDKAKEENVYRRKDVVRCLSAESWHKEGRQVKAGEVPMKRVPVRAVTLTRKREIEEEERETGEKATQGLYCLEQTEYIIPPPIKDGIIPKNAYGNIDCFVPTMVPKGAVHIPLRGTVRICKKLEIDYAEAVTGFEFGNKRAVPVVMGVVVAEENEHALIDAWQVWEAEQRKKEEGKQEKAVLSLWRKMVMGLRIKERMQEDYGVNLDKPREEVIDLTGDNVGHSLRGTVPASMTEDGIPHDGHDIPQHDSNVGGGGFMPPDGDSGGGGGFLLHDEDEPPPEELVMDENHPRTARAAAEEYPTPVSAPPSKPQQAKKSLVADSAESELSELESSQGASSDEDNEPTPQTNEMPRGKARQIDRVEIFSPKPKARKTTATSSKPRNTRKSTGKVDHSSSVAKSTPRRQNPRKAKSNLKSPYFEGRDDDEDVDEDVDEGEE